MASLTPAFTLDLSGMTKLRAQFDKKYYTKVGIVGSGDKERQDASITNATLMMIAEFGSYSHNIPPRSAIRLPLTAAKPEFQRFVNSKRFAQLMESLNFMQIFKIFGFIGENAIQKAFDTSGFGQWEANKASTIARKGSSKPLIDSAQMRRGVSSEVKTGG